MKRESDLDAIKAALRAGADRLVAQLLPAAVGKGRDKRVDSIETGQAGSAVTLSTAGPKAGKWYDFRAARGGDMLDLIAIRMTGGDIGRAIAWARDWCGLGTMTAEDTARLAAGDARRMAEEKAAEDKRQQRARDTAERIFRKAVHIGGTPAYDYLAGRGIDLRALGKLPGTLRYLPEMRCPETGLMRPCMIAGLMDEAGGFVTIHRTFLFVHHDGQVSKAPMQNAKRAWAVRYAGAYIPLWRGKHNVPMQDAPDGEAVYISEGIEDGLSVAVAMPDRRVIAALSLSNLHGLRLPPCIARVVLLGQNDTKPAAIEATKVAVATLEQRWPVTVSRPPVPHKDWNDWLCAIRGVTPPKAPRRVVEA